MSDQLIFQTGKSSEVYRRNNNGPKTLPCSAPDTILTSLLRQPSPITCCDRQPSPITYCKLCKYIEDRASNTHRTELTENTLMVDPIKGCAEINLHDPRVMPTLQCTLQYMGHSQKCIAGTQIFPISKLGFGSTPQRSRNRSRRTDTRSSNTSDNTDFMEIGR